MDITDALVIRATLGNQPSTLLNTKVEQELIKTANMILHDAYRVIERRHITVTRREPGNTIKTELKDGHT